MTTYSVELTRLAAKDLKNLKGLEADAKEALQALKTDPLKGDALSGNLAGLRSLHFTVTGGGAYRAVYEVQSSVFICLIYAVATRENFYRDAEKRLKRMGLRRSSIQHGS